MLSEKCCSEFCAFCFEAIQQKKCCNFSAAYFIDEGTDSVILMTVVDPEYQFFYPEVGMNGRNSNGGPKSVKKGIRK